MRHECLQEIHNIFVRQLLEDDTLAIIRCIPCDVARAILYLRTVLGVSGLLGCGQEDSPIRPSPQDGGRNRVRILQGIAHARCRCC